MGLIKDLKALRKKREFEAQLSEYGLTPDDLKKLPSLIAKVEKIDYKPEVVLSENEKKTIEEKAKKGMSMEQYFAQFAGDVEEFYPDGKRTS